MSLFEEYKALPTVQAADDLPDIEVLLRWRAWGKYKQDTFGYVVSHDAAWLRKALVQWKTMPPKTKAICEKVLAAWDEHLRNGN